MALLGTILAGLAIYAGSTILDEIFNEEGVKNVANNIDEFVNKENEFAQSGNFAPSEKEKKQQIIDTTGQNEETSINGINFQNALEQEIALRNERWAREDAIRKETQQREDNAISRATEDAIRAGINPNLVNISPAASGGGITSASQIDMNLYQAELEKYMLELEKEMDQNFQGNENEKDRFIKILTNIVTLVGIGAMAKKK